MSIARCCSTVIAVALVFLWAAKFAFADGPPEVTIQPLFRSVDLKIGQEKAVTLADGRSVNLTLVNVRQTRDKIRQAINAIQPSGATNLLAGLKLGYAIARRSFAPKQINHIVLCSDGVANVGQTEADVVLKEVAEDRKQGITITCVGVGYGSYNDVFMGSLANHGDGS